MWLSIVIITASLVVALIGIFLPKPEGRPWIQVTLAAFAVLVAGAGFLKACQDENEKERLQEAGLGPSPSTLRQLEAAIANFAKKSGYGDSVWYGDAFGGLQFFLDGAPRTGAIILNKHDVVRLVAAGATPNEISKLLADQSSNNYGLESTRYDEDVYNRIAIVCGGAVQQLNQVSPNDFFKDVGYGVRVEFPGADGRRNEVRVTPDEIASVPRATKIAYFGRLLEVCREKVRKPSP